MRTLCRHCHHCPCSRQRSPIVVVILLSSPSVSIPIPVVSISFSSLSPRLHPRLHRRHIIMSSLSLSLSPLPLQWCCASVVVVRRVVITVSGHVVTVLSPKFVMVATCRRGRSSGSGEREGEVTLSSCPGCCSHGSVVVVRRDRSGSGSGSGREGDKRERETTTTRHPSHCVVIEVGEGKSVMGVGAVKMPVVRTRARARTRVLLT